MVAHTEDEVTAQNMSPTAKQGLKVARVLMVLSSISPLFVLWAIRGNAVVPEPWFVAFCACMVIVPNSVLWLRIRTVRRQNDKRAVIVGTADDHRDSILVYLFAMLLPFYFGETATAREVAATLVALAFVVFLFWHLDLHYMNVLFAMRGLRVFTVDPPADGNPLTSRERQVVLTRRVRLSPGDRLVAYRLSDTVYLEENE
jgi:hypothetical protein